MTVIDVFADVACPFTHVGLRRLVDLRARRGRTDVGLRVRAWPLEIVNGAPLDPAFIAEEVDDIRRQAAPDLFHGFSADAFPATSLPALALAHTAYEVDLATGERVSLALRDLLFEQRTDIADPQVLHGLAAAHGIRGFDPADASAVLADHAEGVQRGVVGSPHFFTDDGAFFCPALDVSRDDAGHLHVTTDVEAFDAFTTACFG